MFLLVIVYTVRQVHIGTDAMAQRVKLPSTTHTYHMAQVQVLVAPLPTQLPDNAPKEQRKMAQVLGLQHLRVKVEWNSRLLDVWGVDRLVKEPLSLSPLCP